MKRLLAILVIVSISFGASTDEIDKKLNLLLNKLDMLEKQINQKDKEIEQLKQELKIQQKEIKHQEVTTKKEFEVKSCDNLKVTNVKYQYHDNVLPYLTFRVSLKNNYPYEVTHIKGNIYFDDKDGTTFIKHFIDRKVDIKPGESIIISAESMIISDIGKEIKNENPKDLKVYFSPDVIDFKKAPELKCY